MAQLTGKLRRDNALTQGLPGVQVLSTLALIALALVTGFIVGGSSSLRPAHHEAHVSRPRVQIDLPVTEPTTTEECQRPIQTIKTINSNVNMNDNPSLKTLLEFQPTMHPRALQRGIFSHGDPSRMRRFLHKLLSGEPVTVIGVGGSVMAGQGAEDGRGVFQRFEEYIRSTFPHDKHKFIDLAFGGSTNQIFTMCINTMVKDADYVLVEFTVNDKTFLSEHLDKYVKPTDPTAIPITKSFERLLRKLLVFPSQPAVVMLHHYSWFQSQTIDGEGDVYDLINEEGAPYHGPTEWDDDSDDLTKVRALYYDSVENEYTVLGSYYGLPQISIRHVAYHLMAAGVPGYQSHIWSSGHEEDSGVKAEDLFYTDNIHPQSHTGFVLMSELLIELLRNTALDLQRRPYNSLDVEISEEPLPNPMIPHNWERLGTTCMLGTAMEAAVVEQDGRWEFKDERRQHGTTAKWGWIAREPGAWCVLEIDSRSIDQSHADKTKETRNDAVISYLRSYEHMGKFKAECISGCECDPVEINSHVPEERVSVSDAVKMQVTQHEKCRIRIEVLSETTSEENKVKLLGLMLLEGGSSYGNRGVVIDIIVRGMTFRAENPNAG